MNDKPRAHRNRTITLSEAELKVYQSQLLRIDGAIEPDEIENRIMNQDLFDVLDWLPSSFADVLFLDPPYNLTKSFNGNTFKQRSISDYAGWLDSWLPQLLRTLKPNGSVYICGEWRSSAAIQLVAEKYLTVWNRITWEREKGRGSAENWKNCSEDLWFCTLSDTYTFNVEAVKLKRRVMAPYTDADGVPKDWDAAEDGNYRLTHPSNVWNDLTVPFWSMPENTKHPTQKPEKLLAKVILASSNPGEMVFDPFLGSGTTAVVAKKLSRRYAGIEIDPEYCSLALKRLSIADYDDSIQGYSDGLFWERNSQKSRMLTRSRQAAISIAQPLFGPDEDWNIND